MMVDVGYFQADDLFSEVLFGISSSYFCSLPGFHHDDQVCPVNLFFTHDVVIESCVSRVRSVLEYLCCRLASVLSLVADEKYVHVVCNAISGFKFWGVL